MISIITPSQYKKIPWKNGKGFTTELAINEGGHLDDFDWRLSIATVTEDGVFSDFSGYLRNLVLIEGSGISLTHKDHEDNITEDKLVHQLDFATFDGGDTTSASLTSGAIKDFNIIVDSSLYLVQLDTLVKKQQTHLEPCGIGFIYSLSDEVTKIVVEGQTVELEPSNLAKIDNVSNGQYQVSGSEMIIVRLTRK